MLWDSLRFEETLVLIASRNVISRAITYFGVGLKILQWRLVSLKSRWLHKSEAIFWRRFQGRSFSEDLFLSNLGDFRVWGHILASVLSKILQWGLVSLKSRWLHKSEAMSRNWNIGNRSIDPYYENKSVLFLFLILKQVNPLKHK